MDSWHFDGEEEEQEVGLSEFSYGGKDALIFLVDVSVTSMNSVDQENGNSPLQIALKCAHATLRRKVMMQLNLYTVRARIDHLRSIY